MRAIIRRRNQRRALASIAWHASAYRRELAESPAYGPVFTALYEIGVVL